LKKIKESDTYDRVALMSLFNSITDSKTFLVYVKSNNVSNVDGNSLIKLIYDLSNDFMKTLITDNIYFDLFSLTRWPNPTETIKTSYSNGI
jgi:hypothetical protein